MALIKHMRYKNFHRDDFRMITPTGITYTFKQMHIGHEIPKAKGNELTHENFIAELDTDNQGKYRDNKKNVVKYYSLAAQKREMLRQEAYENQDDAMIGELGKVLNTLNFLTEYQNINLDMSMEFDEEGYIEK